MIPPFDIFKRQPGGSVRWLGVVMNLEDAKIRVKELAASCPGEYFIFSLAAGRRLFIKPDNGEESSEAKLPAARLSELENTNESTKKALHANTRSSLAVSATIRLMNSI
jgi:hypothetical protein